MARFLKHNEHRVFQAFNELYDTVGHGIPTIMKGLNATDQGAAIHQAWGRFRDPVGIRTDFSRFDQHVSREALIMEHDVYRAMFRKAQGLGLANGADYSELDRLLRMQLENNCIMALPDGVITYKTWGKRMSGDINTGLGNVVIVCLTMWDYLKQIGIGGANYHLINNGDDCCLVVEREFVELICRTMGDYYIRLGFELVIEGTSEELERVKFCQSCPIEVTPGEWVMVRDYDVSRVKDASNMRRMDGVKDFDEWRSAIAGCGLALCSGVPVMQEFYLALTRGVTPLHKDVYRCGADFLARGMASRVREVADCARVSFFMAYGITPDEQEVMEAYYRGITPTFTIIDEVVQGTCGSANAC
jgi:hypothetical protein